MSDDTRLLMRAYEMLLLIRTEENQEAEVNGSILNQLIGSLNCQLRSSGVKGLAPVEDVISLSAYQKAEKKWDEQISMATRRAFLCFPDTKTIDMRIHIPWLDDLGVGEVFRTDDIAALDSSKFSPHQWTQESKGEFFAIIRQYAENQTGFSHIKFFIRSSWRCEPTDKYSSFTYILSQICARSEHVGCFLVSFLGEG